MINSAYPLGCVLLVFNACHDAPASGGHVAFNTMYDRLRGRYWCPTMSKDDKHVHNCLSCQHRKTPHCSPRLPAGHRPDCRLDTGPLPVRSSVAIDLVVEYKSPSHGYKYCQSLTTSRFLVLIPVCGKKASTVASALVERVFSVFSSPETLRSDQGTDFENELVK